MRTTLGMISFVMFCLVNAAGIGCGGDGGGGGPEVTVSDPTDGAGGFLWKPVSDSDRNLVVLLSSNFNNQVDRVEVHRASPPDEGTFVEGGRFAGIANGNRSHFRFARPGGAFGANVWTIVFRKDEAVFGYPIPNGSQRID